MAVSGNTQQSIRKALGVLKDSTMVGLAKVNSDYKGLDIAIVKATNHVEVIPKEKHVRKIFNAISAGRPRADVAYCISSLARRLAKTSNWAVALKTLVVIHRALREVDPSFREELMKYRSTRPKTLNLSHFIDDSSTPAWDYSAWVRSYAMFLEEKLECFRILKYDIETDRSRTTELETNELLEQLPALQDLLLRLVGCQPEGAAIHNNLIRFALSMVAHESIKIYAAVSTGTHNLADQFFDMERHDAIRALGIYRKAGTQAGSLNEFYKICKRLELGRPGDFNRVEQPPESFLKAMQEYIKNTSHKNMADNGREILAIEYRKSDEDNEESEEITTSSSNHVSIEPSKSPVKSSPAPPVADLLCLDDFLAQEETINEVEEHNPLALALVSNDNMPNQGGISALGNGMEDWELALVSEPVSDQAPITEIKLAGGFEGLNLDNLYNNANGSTNLNLGFPIEDQTAPNPFEIVPFGTEITPNNAAIGTEIDFFVPNTEITPNIVPIETQMGLFGTEITPNSAPIGTHVDPFATEITTSNNVPIGNQMDLFGTEISPNNAPFDTKMNSFLTPDRENTLSTIPIGTEVDFFAPKTEINPNNSIPVGTEMDFFAPKTEINPNNTVPMGTEMDFFAPKTEINPNSSIPVGTEMDFFAPKTEINPNSTVPIGTEMTFFAPKTEVNANDTVPFGTDINFFAPKTEINPNNTVPVGTQMDSFFMPNMEVIPNNVPIGTESEQQRELIIPAQGQNHDANHGSTNNPFGNPFM